MSKNLRSHEYYMSRCLQIAQNGELYSAPNPCVGAVIVYQNRIIGEGYSDQAGGSHAEVRAIQAVREEDKKWLCQATLYVTLEPCSHHGKTPPCANLIVENNIPRVIIGTLDPNPLVAGQGVQILQQAEIEVVTDVLQKECQWSMRKFIHAMKYERPYVTLKWAESINQKIAQGDGKPVQITTSSTQILTHQLRAAHQAILCGWKTVWYDQPSLNNRLWLGNSPQVIVIDYHQKLNESDYFKQQSNWWRIVREKSERENDIQFQGNNLKELLELLYKHQIQSIFVEGGAYTHQQFIDTNLWNECYIYQGYIQIKDGLSAPELTKAELKRSYTLESDLIKHYLPSI